MSTFTLRADFNEVDGTETATKHVTIQMNTQVTGSGGVIWDPASVPLVNGVLNVTLPATDNAPGTFGYVVSRGNGMTRRWNVPAQAPGATVELTTFTSTTPLPIPSGLVEVPEGLETTGTPDATTFLRGDGAWAVPAGGGGGGAVSSVAGRTGAVVLTSTDVGLGNVTNTSDANKPVSTAQAAADTAVQAAAIAAAATDATTKANAAQAAAVQRANHTGTQSADTLTDGTTNKAFLATERTKLTGIATGATANSTDATLLARANHTGTQAVGTITGLGTAATVNTGTTSGTIPLLSTGGVLPIARLATGTPDGTKFLRDDGTLAAAPASKFRADLSAYNLTSSSLRLARAAAARAAAGGATFHIATVGDSTEVGTPGATTFTNMWHRVLLANLLSRGNATRGTGMLSPNVAKRTGGPMTTTGLAEGHGAGIVKSSAYLPGGSGNTVTVTATTDQFRVMYQKRSSSGGTITATVDGGAVASIDTSSTGGTGVFFKTYDVTEGSHTLVMTAPAAGNGFILGVEARRGGANGSVKVDGFGYGGRTSVALADSTTEGDASSIQSITALAADLLIVSIGINDYLGAGDAAPNQTTLATYKTNMQAAITAQRAVGGDVLLIGWPPQGGTPPAIPQSSYIQKLYELCDENDVAMLDLQSRWASFAVSNPLGYYYDEVHPNDLGLADWGSAVYTLLNSVGIVL